MIRRPFMWRKMYTTVPIGHSTIAAAAKARKPKVGPPPCNGMDCSSCRTARTWAPQRPPSWSLKWEKSKEERTAKAFVPTIAVETQHSKSVQRLEEKEVYEGWDLRPQLVFLWSHGAVRSVVMTRSNKTFLWVPLVAHDGGGDGWERKVQVTRR